MRGIFYYSRESRPPKTNIAAANDTTRCYLQHYKTLPLYSKAVDDMQQRREQQATYVHSPVVQILCWDIDTNKINQKILHIGQNTKSLLLPCSLTEQHRSNKCNFTRQVFTRTFNPFHITQPAYPDILHIKPTILPVENCNRCVAFHVGEKR